MIKKYFLSMLLVVTAFMLLSCQKKNEELFKDEVKEIKHGSIETSSKNFDWLTLESDAENIQILNVGNDAYLASYKIGADKYVKLIDTNGDILWEKDNVSDDIIQTSKGFIILYEDNQRDYFVHINNQGEVIWEKGPYTMGFIKFDLNSLKEDGDNNGVVFRYLLYRRDYTYTAILLKEDGSELISIDVGDQVLPLIMKTKDNGYLVRRETQSSYYLDKYNDNGDKEWEQGPFDYISAFYEFNDSVIMDVTKGQDQFITSIDDKGHQIAELGPLSTVEVHTNSNCNDKSLYLVYEKGDTEYLERVNADLEQQWKIKQKKVAGLKILGNYLVFYYRNDNINEVVKYNVTGTKIAEVPITEMVTIIDFDRDNLFIEKWNLDNSYFILYNHDGDEIFKLGSYHSIKLIRKVNNDYFFAYTDEAHNFYLKKIDSSGQTVWEQGPYDSQGGYDGIKEVYPLNETDILYRYELNDNEYITIVDEQGDIIYDKPCLSINYYNNDGYIRYYAGDINNQVDEIVVYID